MRVKRHRDCCACPGRPNARNHLEEATQGAQLPEANGGDETAGETDAGALAALDAQADLKISTGQSLKEATRRIARGRGGCRGRRRSL